MTVMSFFYSRYFGRTESRNSIIVISWSLRNLVTVVSKFWNIVTTMSLDFWPKNLVTEISFSEVDGAASKNFVTEMSFSLLNSGGPFRYFVTAIPSSSVSKKRVEEVPRNFVTDISSAVWSRNLVTVVSKYIW